MLSVDMLEKCSTIQEALEKLQRDEAMMPIAGGTDLLVKLRGGILPEHSRLLDISCLSEMRGIHAGESLVRIGALTPHQIVAENEIIRRYYPGLAAACGKVGSLQIRNHASIGGNIANASPAADSVPVLAALDARLCCESLESDGSKRRRITGVEEYLRDKAGGRLPGRELITEICLDMPAQGDTCVYYKVGGRKSLAIAICSCAVARKNGAYQIAFGSMSQYVERLTEVEKYVNEHKRYSQKEMLAVLRQCLTPISDVRASAQYRILTAANILGILLEECGEEVIWDNGASC